METLSGIYAFLMGNIVTFILVLSLLVFVHEMGHYLVARWSGIRILAFSVGFGPEIFGFTDRHGTRWKISVIPLGGYVRFFGDEDSSSKPDTDKIAAMSEEDRARSFAGAKLWKRAATVAAGPIANFLLAIAIFTILFSVYGRMIADPVVAEVKPDGAAAAAGILPGDLLVAIDGGKVETFDDVRRYVSIRPSQQIVVTIERAGQKLDVPMVPQRTDTTDQFGNKAEVGQIGIVTNQQAGNFRLQTYTPLQALRESVLQTRDIVTGTFKYIGNIFSGTMRADQLGGPIRVAQASGQMASLGIGAVLQLAAVLSVSIGLLNLMPVPVLDGGHLMFYAVEAVRGKPLGSTAQEIAFRIGLAMILTLMVFTTWNDIGSWIG
ncbi:RIP metalloprotease RseP [Rhizobium ruizarguesonis]|jgi:regulator of sigma E protease|uniref:RIP metalloprotease RseP n=1 Tax=Rhizobium ruizarguesonis TaxID=2081791 RepID=UPI00102FF7B5|nr:RIP metalloprotease RseP [Rhizobium ruizarguesonis]TAT78387.1 RIP metalloprotease RseP [Rhizobium ruizarguesonis]TAT88307.1 RIP metalloprotease RseP [Rhizobium ruizarguesonis]TAY79105.1 RIP metalloprotease RseP [Rhizobium ruizarguesonis]TAZ34777.1 RIP metalloprotease RseP [Rhizobium ruizarguesonis]TAZ72880.1 RIP metalloprotease RseP [Rhizobium ruizarguesonis]